MKINKGSYTIDIDPTEAGCKATFSNGGSTLYGDSKNSVLIQLRDNEEITQAAFENYLNAEIKRDSREIPFDSTKEMVLHDLRVLAVEAEEAGDADTAEFADELADYILLKMAEGELRKRSQ